MNTHTQAHTYTIYNFASFSAWKTSKELLKVKVFKKDIEIWLNQLKVIQFAYKLNTIY